MRKKIALFVIFLFLVTFSFGCNKAATEGKAIRFGLLPAEAAIPIIVAEEKGFFDNEGVDVELVPFNSPNDRNVAVQAGQLEAIIADVMTSLTLHEAGINMKITSDINEDFKLLASPQSGIDSIAKLDGKDVSIVPGFVLEYIMDEMATKNGIQYKNVTIPSIPARSEALLKNQISAVIYTEPQATYLISQGAKLLASSKEYGLKAGTLLFSEAAVKEQPKGIKAFYRAYNKAVEYMNKTDSAEYSSNLSSYGFPEAVTAYLSSGVKYEKAQKITEESFRSVLEWTHTKGTVTKDYSLQDVSNFSFIE